MSKVIRNLYLILSFLVGFDDKESENFLRFANLRNILAYEHPDTLYKEIQNFSEDFQNFTKRFSSL
ncbi:MAG: hypothetical protein ABIM98_06860 [candidate division WOR-3 bacterium]